MEQLSATPAFRDKVRPYGLPSSRAADAFDTVAWRAPAASRFDSRPANDVSEPQETLSQLLRDTPAWVGIVFGAAGAAIMGALLGGALHI